MINNIRFNIIAGKINKIPEFYTLFAWKMPDYIIRQQDRSRAKASRPRPKFWPWGHFGIEDLTSLKWKGTGKSESSLATLTTETVNCTQAILVYTEGLLLELYWFTQQQT